MMGSFFIRGLILGLGYLCPAYECFKCIENKKADERQLQLWCEYWIIVAVGTILERLGDTFISWVPFYNEAKLAFVIYLWCSKKKGTMYIYSAFVKPFVTQHEPEIDQNMKQVKTIIESHVSLYWQRSLVYLQSRTLELLQHLVSQSSKSHDSLVQISPPNDPDIAFPN